MRHLLKMFLIFIISLMSINANANETEKAKMISASQVEYVIATTKERQGEYTSDQIQDIIKEVSVKYQSQVDIYGINLNALAKAHAKIESGFDPYNYLMETINNVENADVSLGLFQVLTKTARGVMGWSTTKYSDIKVMEMLLDPKINAEAGIRYIVSRVKKYYPTNGLETAIRCYNSGSPLTTASKFYEANLKYGKEGLKYYTQYYTEITGKELSNSDISPKPVAAIFTPTNIVVGSLLGALAIWLYFKFSIKPKRM